MTLIVAHAAPVVPAATTAPGARARVVMLGASQTATVVG